MPKNFRRTEFSIEEYFRLFNVNQPRRGKVILKPVFFHDKLSILFSVLNRHTLIVQLFNNKNFINHLRQLRPIFPSVGYSGHTVHQSR